ncbi:MAG TPA: IS110 family transposase [Bacillus sp. (in: firmicutes)]|jgi:transposase|nr:IS110 family transposase [Bacillus sp. (in: firmicutes)]HVI20824.1 IS110 family transposase [Bacillus sp. (in: firmicutes)]
MNHLGIDVGKRKCRAALKDDKGKILDEFFFGNDGDGIHNLLSRIQSHGKCSTRAVLESTGNMWMKIHDTLEENEIDTKLANPYKTRIIAEAKIKSDKLDARILSDLLRTDLIYESYVPNKEDRDRRSLVRHRITLSRTKTKLVNKVHSILDKYDYQTNLTDIFSKSGIEWLRSLSSQVTPVDRIILDSSIASIETINQQIATVSKEISKYASSLDNKDVKILLSITGIDIFSAMLISTEIVDVKRFSTPWKLVSYAGLAPSIRESSGKTKTGKITKQGSPWLRWILVQCALTAIRYDAHLRTFYDRIRNRKGHATAIVATAKELLVIIWYMLNRNELYRYMDKQRYEQKMQKLEQR